jgi:hypothetical protein
MARATPAPLNVRAYWTSVVSHTHIVTRINLKHGVYILPLPDF